MIKVKFDISKIEVSRNDIRRCISIPETITEELAEFLGAFVGDGHLGLHSGRYGKNTYTHYEINMSGNIEEKDYLDYINNRFNSLFNIRMYYLKQGNNKSILIKIDSKGILHFLNKICDIPLNFKTDSVRIPFIIKNSNIRMKSAFLRGLFDTDFSLSFKNKNFRGYTYPVIKGSFASKTLIEDLEEFFRDLSFKSNVIYNLKEYDKRFNKYYIKHAIYLNGKDNLKKWIYYIGSSNKKFQRKIAKWQESGSCEPRY